MKLQLTTLATARKLAIMNARFQILASTGLDPQQKWSLSQRLEDNLSYRINTLADTALLRIRDRPVLSDAAKKSFQKELTRLQCNIVDGSQTLQ